MIKETNSENVGGLTSDTENCVRKPEIEVVTHESRCFQIWLSDFDAALGVIETIFDRSKFEEDEIISAMLEKFTEQLLAEANGVEKFMEECIWE